VWEVHLAGGMALDGYWLDAHSDAVAPALLELTAEIVPRLPNLGAIVFEILPQHLPRIGIDACVASSGSWPKYGPCARPIRRRFRLPPIPVPRLQSPKRRQARTIRNWRRGKTPCARRFAVTPCLPVLPT